MTQGAPIPMAALADTALDPATALSVAEEVLVAQQPLQSTFKMSKVHGEVTGRFPGGFSYRTYVQSRVSKFRMNDGFVTAQGGPGATRIQIHENKRYQMMMGIGVVIAVAIIAIIYFAFLRPSGPPAGYAPAYPGYGGPAPSSGSNWGTTGMLIGGGVGLVFTVFQFMEISSLPKKAAQMIGYRAMIIAQGGNPGPIAPQAGHPVPNPAWSQPPQPGFAPMQQPGIAPTGPSPVDQLRDLAQRRDSGAISPADYEQAKAAILARLG